MVKAMVLCAALCGCAVVAEGDSISVEESALEGGGAGTSTFWVVHDGRMCASAPAECGYVVGRLNRLLTWCPDGVPRLFCHVNAIDTSKLNQADERLAAWPAWLDRTLGVLVHGRLEETAHATRLVADELWVAGGASGTVAGAAVRVEQTGIRCIQEPCEDKQERLVNHGASARIAELDFRPARLTPDEELIAMVSLLPEYGGLAVLGQRYTVARNGIVARGRTVSQFYTRWPPPGDAPMSAFACEALDGTVRVDIGDGQVACGDAERSLGAVATGIEGGVCCKPR
jgi:hypothetical protein